MSGLRLIGKFEGTFSDPALLWLVRSTKVQTHAAAPRRLCELRLHPGSRIYTLRSQLTVCSQAPHLFSSFSGGKGALRVMSFIYSNSVLKVSTGPEPHWKPGVAGAGLRWQDQGWPTKNTAHIRAAKPIPSPSRPCATFVAVLRSTGLCEFSKCLLALLVSSSLDGGMALHGTDTTLGTATGESTNNGC